MLLGRAIYFVCVVVVLVHNMDILHTFQHSCTASHSVCPYCSHLIGTEWMCILTTETAVAKHVCAVYVRVVGGIQYRLTCHDNTSVLLK